MATMVMVRTMCCETFKCSGVRCANCPNRPENREAVRNYLEQVKTTRPGRRYSSPIVSIQPSVEVTAP